MTKGGEVLKNNYTVSSRKRFLFYILMILSLLCIMALQFFGQNERDGNTTEKNLIYQGTFTWQKSDGSSEKISVPGQYDVKAKDTMTILTRLPEDYHENTLAIRSSLQSVRFYVDGELRMEYDTSGTRLVGKNSASCYVFCPTSEDDAGKEVRIELTTNTAKYSGVVNTVYCGDEAAIWGYLFQTYGLETVIALFLLFAGIITIIFGFSLGIAYQTKFDMEYLGWVRFYAAIWMLGESKMRQLFFPNPSALATLCFVMIMLMSDRNRILYGYAAERKIPESIWSGRKHSISECSDLFSTSYSWDCGLYRDTSCCPCDPCRQRSDWVHYDGL